MSAKTNSKASGTIGDASSAIFLLRDYSRFGLTERICYHFDLTEALTASAGRTTLPTVAETETSYRKLEDASIENKDPRYHQNTFEDRSACGVLQVLELAPVASSVPVTHKVSKRQKRFLRMRLRKFNEAAENAHCDQNTICYQPQDLPLRCNPSTKVLFGYEKTRIAFCVDASASLTSLFGVNGNRPRKGNNKENVFCPLDRLPEMARIFFASLAEPITSTSTSKPWKPLVSVTVLAVYPMGKVSETSLLVRDFLVHDALSAKRLTDMIEHWIHSEVECGISERMSRRQPGNTWSIPIYSSNLQHILEAGDYALDVLSSEARPIIVVATDGRSISCDGIVDVFLDVDRVDIPVHVLDLSLTETHTMEDDVHRSSKYEMNFLTYDPGGNMGFPLYLTDDSEALFVVCRATGGCFLDLSLLSDIAKSTAGQQQITDELAQQSYSFKRRFVKMNGLQWLALFSVSPISPTFNASWGKLIPPSYLQKQLSKSIMEGAESTAMQTNYASDLLDSSRHKSNIRLSTTDTLDLSRHKGTFRLPTPGINETSQRNSNDVLTSTGRRHHNNARTTFSTYVVSPVRIKALLLTRIKEGYRAKQYGLSTHDPDKVFIQFTLPLESGTILHYELSYKALSSENHLVGSAHIKIELSGNPSFVQAVKNDFLHQSDQVPEQRLYTVRQKRSKGLCQVIRGIRRGDLLQSYLRPPASWDNILQTPGSPFVKRLGTLTRVERKRHFQADKFDVVCTGGIPYGLEDNFLSEFMTNQDGKQQLIDAVTEWSSQIMTKDSRYLKRVANSGNMTNYCVVEIVESRKASQLFTIKVEFFGGTDPIRRFQTLHSLKNVINELKQVVVLQKQLGRFLIGNREHTLLKNNIEIQFHRATWDLVKDPELLSLLSKRRTEIGGFRLLESRDDYALFAKLKPETIDSPGDLVQYEIAVHDDKVVIDLHMESEGGVFNPYHSEAGETSKFGKMVNTIRRRDQECGRALRSRTTLLRSLVERYEVDPLDESHEESVKRLLQYTSRVTRTLRFFSSFGDANSILVQLTSDLLLSKRFGVKSAGLNINPDSIIRDEDPGVWFIIQYDHQTMSVVHLSLVDSAESYEDLQTAREMTFFTLGISDLYSKRDDLADDDSIETHISEHLCVSDFTDRFERVQMKNFSVAGYLALRQAPSNSNEKINPIDFEQLVTGLRFVEVNSFVVGGSLSHAGETESKLLRSIKTVLSPVPGDEYHFFYTGHIKIEILEDDENESRETSDDDSSRSDDLNVSRVTDSIFGKEEEPIDEDRHGNDNEEYNLSPPIFVKFHLDGKTASLQELNCIDKSTVLTVTVSVFDPNIDGLGSCPSPAHLPISHQSFALEIGRLLKSYIAEQTLDRLKDAEYLDEDLQMVRKCMAKIRSVVSFVIEIYFFISRRNMMMPAAAPAGGEAEVEEGLLILEMELLNNGYFILRPISNGVFFLSDIIVGDEGPLSFWCLLKLEPSGGTISAQVYHPDGEEIALSIMSRIHSVLCSCINLVNQQLLLRSLHRTRTASELLIPKQNQQLEAVTESKAEMFSPGIFQCPIVFRKTFGLYHRAATNPGQVARTLEATVLHNFAVSNRSGIFVYKDETDAIFYMKIEPRGSGIDADGEVELLVYGVRRPGPSVTEQLSVLLQRRLLVIGVDMLSSVLTKNPHFKWKAADFTFLRSFDSEWKKLDTEKGGNKSSSYYFKFPAEVYDPCMVLLLFRQNLCGSTFFHRLNDISQDGSTPSPTVGIRGVLESGGTSIAMNNHDFSLYFNNAPSKLDPAFQGFTTLTEKGADYCRRIGQGIAIVEFTLTNGDGSSANDLQFAQPITESCSLAELPLEHIRMESFGQTLPESSVHSTFIRITITDTALNTDILKDWLFLTLNQALIAWVTERVIERSFFKLMKPEKDIRSNLVDRKQTRYIQNLCPGLPVIQRILESSHSLPHPAITKFEKVGMVRSSKVAILTLELLENSILAPLVESKMIGLVDIDATSRRLFSDRMSSNLRIIRVSRSERPSVVSLKWKGNGRKMVSVSISSTTGNGRLVEDSPVDCPEYICFFTLAERDSIVQNIDPQLRIYREVVIHDGISEKSESIQLLQSVKKATPQAFMRSFGFILSVKRNSRRLWTYNWNPKLVKSVQTRLNDIDILNLADTHRDSNALQRCSLGCLSPGSVEAPQKKKLQTFSEKEDEKSSKGSETDTKTDVQTSGPARRIRRPTMIRRPKLIGKSVEGAAMQAMAASRKRASTNQFKNKTNPVIGSKASNRLQVKKESGRLVTGAGRNQDSNLVRSQSTKTRLQTERSDESLTRVLNDFSSLSSAKVGEVRRLSSVLRHAQFCLTNIWWPQNRSQTIPKSVAEFLISMAPASWNDICSVPPLPKGVLDVFVPTLARWIVALTPGIELVSTSPSSSTESNRTDSVLLSTELRNVHGTKCCAVIRISLLDPKNTAHRVHLVRSEGWVLNLQRRPNGKKGNKRVRRYSNLRSSCLTEKDSAGMDKVLADIHNRLILESLLFDFSASMVERAVRLLDRRIHFADLVPTIQTLMARYPYDHQKSMTRLNYRAFEATIIPKSYNDRLIDMFDADTLLNRLRVEVEDRDMVLCGDALCLKTISVKGSHSLCFLTGYPGEKEKMKLVCLTRTQGLDLSDFMFREGCNVAIHILDNIGVEASRLVLNELHFVAECLLKDSLWKSFSSRRSASTPASSFISRIPQQQHLHELLRLVPSHPFLQLPMTGSFKNSRPATEISFLFGSESGINWLSLCSSMKQNKFFSPHSSTEDKGSINNLFYVHRYDVFLMIVVKRDSSLARIDLIEKRRVPENYTMIFDAVVNFILHYIWYNL